MNDTETTDATAQTLREDPDEQYDFLIEREVLVEHDDGSVAPTVAFEDHRGIYVDSYADASDQRFRETVAELFGVSVEAAETHIKDNDLTRWELATFLAVREHLDVDLPTDLTLELAAMTVAAGDASPVPPSLPAVTDESYEQFLADNPDAVVFVFQLHCSPCQRLKKDLDALRELPPVPATFAGLDGDESTAFRREFDVDVAPTTLVFADGEFVEKREGYAPPEAFADWFADCYAD